MMQQSAVEQINAFEKNNIIMKYEFDRMTYQMEDMRRQRSVRSATGSARGDSASAASVHEDHQPVRRNIAATPVASRPQEAEPDPWESLHKNRDEGFAWIMGFEAPRATMAKLHDSEKFPSFDAQLSSALFVVLSGEQSTT